MGVKWRLVQFLLMLLFAALPLIFAENIPCFYFTFMAHCRADMAITSPVLSCTMQAGHQGLQAVSWQRWSHAWWTARSLTTFYKRDSIQVLQQWLLQIPHILFGWLNCLHQLQAQLSDMRGGSVSRWHCMHLSLMQQTSLSHSISLSDSKNWWYSEMHLNSVT